MNWVDTISLAVWAAAALLGLWAGLLRVSVLFACLIVGAGVASSLGPLAGPAVFPFVDSEGRQELAGFFLVYGGMLAFGLVVTLVAWVPLSAASAFMSLVPWLGQFNRVGGLAAGFLGALVLLSITLLGLQQYPVPAVGKAIAESSAASAPIAWVDRYVTAIEISEEWKDRD